MAPQVGLEPTTLRLTAGCSAIELLRSVVGRLGIAARSHCTANHIKAPASLKTASPVTIVCPFPSPAARRDGPARFVSPSAAPPLTGDDLPGRPTAVVAQSHYPHPQGATPGATSEGLTSLLQHAIKTRFAPISALEPVSSSGCCPAQT